MKKLKNLFYGIALVLAIFTFGQGFNIISQVYASTTNSQIINLNSTITNNSFNNNPTTSSLDSTPSGWSKINTSGSDTSTCGIINTSKTSYFSTEYKLGDNSIDKIVGSDDKILMLNAIGVNKETWQGYKSNNITLEKNSYYKISVYVKTLANNGIASIAILGLNDTENIVTENLIQNNIKSTTSNTEWQEYSFYIATSYEDENINLALCLGDIQFSKTGELTSKTPVSDGAVFFDEVTLNKYSYNKYDSEITNQNLTKFKEISVPKYNTDLNSDDTINEKFDFENNFSLNNWEKFGNYGDGTLKVQNMNNNELGLCYDWDSSFKSALLIGTDKENEGYLGIKSPVIQIKQAQIYKLNFMVKCSEDFGTATAKVVETDYLKENYNLDLETNSAELTIKQGTNQLTNDYILYSFIISGYELYDTEVQLQFAIGSEATASYGYMAVANIGVQFYPYSLFNDTDADSTNSEKLTLTCIKSTPTFTNGMFNIAYSNTVETSYPLTPSNWQVSSTNENDTVFGVVNTNSWANIPNANIPKNPSLIPENASNNILLAYNKASNNAVTQTITSDEFTIPADTTKTISFYYLAKGNEILNIKLVNNNNNTIYQDLKLGTNTDWKNYLIVVKTEEFATTVKFQLEVTTNANQSGYVYFDFFQLSDTVADTTNIIDLSDYGTHLKSSDIDSNGLYSPLMYNGALENCTQPTNSSAIAIAGIITQVNDYEVSFPDGIKDMFLISNLTADCQYAYTSKEPISVTSGNYYKFNIKVLTRNVATPQDTTSNYGAYFELSGLEDAKISKIVTNTDYSSYTIYLKCEETSNANFKFGLVGEGQALFHSLNYETITSIDYAKATNTSNTLLVKNLAVEDDEPESTPTATSPANIWILLSSIILVIAMFVALIGAMLRKVEIKKIKVKRQTDYNRKATLVRDISVIEAENRRDAEIKELNKEKEKLKNYILELEEDNKKRIAEERKEYGKKITRKSEREFRIYASHRQKLVKDIERLDAKIQEAKSPEYLLRIVKIVQSEKVQELDVKPVENPESADTTNK